MDFREELSKWKERINSFDNKRFADLSNEDTEKVYWQMPFMSLKWYVYLVVFVLGGLVKIVCFWWFYVGFRNFLKKKYSPYILEDTNKEPSKVFNNIIEVDGSLKEKVFSEQEKEISGGQKLTLFIKGMLAFVLGFWSLTLNSFIWNSFDSVGGEEKTQKRVKKSERVKTYSRRFDYSSLEYPLEIKVSYPVGTRVFSDTTINYTVLDTLKEDERLEALAIRGEYFIVNYLNDTGYVYKGHVRVIKKK